ncbi:hypothetical protein MMC17_007798 [Xylographa soralifera]|nr:hypothetical protein [Xylographa soralifera]
MLAALPISFNFQPTWGSTIGKIIHHHCEQLLANLPVAGIFAPTAPWILSFGNCFMGVYVTSPFTPRNAPVSESWDVIHSWTMGAMLLYAGTVPAGWTLNLRSGIQICMWHGSLLDLSLKNPMPGTMRSPNGDLSSAVTRLARERRSSGAPFTALQLGMHAHPQLNEPTGVAHMVFGWVANPGIPLEDCHFILASFHVSDWFLSNGGIFLQVPMILNYRRCSFAIFFSVPPEDGRGRLAAPTGNPTMYAETIRLLQETTHRNHIVGGYIDLSNGLQIALYNTEVADPRFLCSLITKISLKQCLENNLVANLRHGG